MIKLESVYDNEDHFEILYNLLLEREVNQSISHKAMPTAHSHIEFVDSEPYLAWYFIQDGDHSVGSVYLTHQREIGISVFKQYRGKGYGRKAMELLLLAHPGKFLANINPKNEASIRFFEGFGAKHIQNTYEI